MGFAGFLAITLGILLAVLSANGRLQNVIAAALGQNAPGATPTSSNGWSSDPGQAGNGSAGGWGNILSGLGGVLNNIGGGSGGGDGGGGSGGTDAGGFGMG